MSPNRAHPLRPGETAFADLTLLIMILNARPDPELGATCALLLATAAAHRRLA
ncbi:hypothetical protein [Streptomyces sp. NPDC058304]|uniref:hypothetical protein n=1 Tax=Streptomyces sp. NPDC058304 TaxID=3346437 RepID=UPI0036E35711